MARNRRNRNTATQQNSENTMTDSNVQEENLQEETMSVEPVNEAVVTAVEETVETPVSNQTDVQKTPEPGLKIDSLKMSLVSFMEETSLDKIQTPEFIARQQFGLFNVFKTIFNSNDQEEFNTKFGAVLKFFNDHSDKDNLSLKFIFRHPYAWPGSQNEYTFYRRLVYTIIETADPKTRKKNVADINLETVANGLTERQKNFLFSFYER